MPKAEYRTPHKTFTIDVEPETSLMQAAVDNIIPGIDGDCGGQAACATCHVHVDADWLKKLPAIEPLEDGMLNTVVDRKPNSRLACQISMNADLDGIIVNVPIAQH
ncbi:MAG: 2Fe-2S iron-sulfur cluster-binding protein [Pseudomonadota bacterium]